MNTILLIFFAIPLAVIIFSIALQKLLKCSALVAGIVFAIGVIVTFIIGSLIVLAATLVYTLISYITALIVCLINRHCHNNDDDCCRRNRCWNNNENDLLTISSRCQNNRNGDLLTINSSCANGNNNDISTANTINGVIRIVDSNGNSSCNNDEITTRINVVPNTANNGRTGCICGRYRRR